VPTLILWGPRIAGCDRRPFRFQGDIKGAQLEIFEALGHNPMEEDPKATAAALPPSSSRSRQGPHRRRSRRRTRPSSVGRAGEGLSPTSDSCSDRGQRHRLGEGVIGNRLDLRLVRFWMGCGRRPPPVEAQRFALCRDAVDEARVTMFTPGRPRLSRL